MTTAYVGHGRVDYDHFHPDAQPDPAAARRLRGQLERIDYTSYACNREVVARLVGPAPVERFQPLALAAAHARAAWVAEALAMAAGGPALDASAIERLATLRRAFEELREAYEAARRMVERGYLPPDAAAA